MVNLSTYYYVQGIIMSLIGIGFYLYGLVNLSVQESSLKTFLKLLFSFSAAWVLSTTIKGSIIALAEHSNLRANWFILVIVYIFPYISFIGFQMFLYDLFKKD